ncbi:hypothetical protein WICMUC_002633 [Wickerhamomyces mucosus]|uniref:Uncharacterized protein n=1 Tax=Wickerhamomyces mucosus TaxID=1378264 RepID=A0A9P8TE73_9ASCO|nr:hypothetical protein WICMUC_002633 [Wickerhamomyces mucosus]
MNQADVSSLNSFVTNEGSLSGSFDSDQDSFDDTGLGSPTFLVTDLLTSLGETNQDADYLVTKGNDLVVLLQGYPYIKEDLVFSAFGHRLQTLLTHQKKEVVATGYRICRYVIYNLDSIKSLMSLRLDVLIIISLSKSSSSDVEREQALKLIRRIIDMPNGVFEITKGICYAILAIAEQADDKLRRVCIETCCEISLLRPGLLSPEILIQFIVDANIKNYDIALICSSVILSSLNSPEGRKHFNSKDICKLISPFTDFHQVDLFKFENPSAEQKRFLHVSLDKLNVNCALISTILKDLNGLYAFSLDNFTPLKSLLNCLKYPVNTMVSKLLDLLLDILLIKPYEIRHSSNKAVLVPIKLENEFILKKQYLSLLLTSLLKCDVLDNLVYVLKFSNDETNSTKSAFLLTEIFNLCSNIVPDEYREYFGGDLGVSDNLNNKYYQINGKYIDFNDSIKAINFIEKLTRKSNKGRLTLGLQDYIKSENNSNDFNKLIKDNELKKSKINYLIDEVELKQMIIDTKVLSTKNFTKWNCEVLTDLFKGPFMNGKRLDEVNKTTKFLKRLLSFYRPFKHKFSGTKRTKNSMRFIKLGCDIFETLLSSNEGLKLLEENKILPQIAECLAQLDPYSGFYAKDQIFNQQRLSTTLTSGYFNFLGVLSNDKNGLKLLEKWKIFTIFHHITDNPYKREDIIILFMDEMKFAKPGNLRVFLSKFLHSKNIIIKIHAIKLLQKLLFDKSNHEDFILELLIEELYESNYDEEIRSMVINILKKYCDESCQNLNKIVKLSPSIEILTKRFKIPKYINLNEITNEMLMKFLSTSEGFEFLNKSGFVDDQFLLWLNGGKYLTYVYEIEERLSLSNESIQRKELPVNLFGELVKTDEGLNIVTKSGVLMEFINTIRHYSTLLNQNRDEELLNFNSLKLKASIWSIGFISSVERGIAELDINGCIEDIITISKKTPSMDIKGTCFYVFGLISMTLEGLEILDEMGWCIKLNIYEKPIGVALPKDILKFIDFQTDSNDNDDIIVVKDEINIIDEIDEEDLILIRLLKIVGKLCTPLYFEVYSEALLSLSKKNPEYFEDPNVFYLVLKYFECYRYRFTMRKFIIELFMNNGKLLEVLVRRDKKRIKEMH